MLTPDQLQAIDRHLRSQLSERKWLRQEEFMAEITDHYTHSILEHMNQGDAFDMALTNVYNDFGQKAGIKQLELTYWKYSSQKLRSEVGHHMLNYLSFPLVFITVPLIGLFLVIRFKLAWVFSSPFGSMPYAISHSSVYSIAILSLSATLLKKYSWYAGRFQPFVQKIATPLRSVTNCFLAVFYLEMVSSPLLIGKASPYVATLLYTISLLLYVGYKKAINDDTVLPRAS